MAVGSLARTAPEVPAQDESFKKWEQDIAEFERLDRESGRPTGGVVFVGSSSVRRWNLAESFPEKGYVNRGFGGSQIKDVTHFASRIIAPLHPKIVVVYAGDNDIKEGRSVEQVVNDFQELVAAIRMGTPKGQIIFVAIKPSIARWEMYPKMAQANRRIAALCERDPLLWFADIATPMLEGDGPPSAELFVEDGLHLSPAGYQIWTKVGRWAARRGAGQARTYR